MPAYRDAESDLDQGLARIGGVAAILLGVLAALVGIVYLLLPAEQRLNEHGVRLLPSFAENGTLLRVEFALLAGMGILGLAVVPALSALVREAAAGLIRVAGILAVVGFALSAAGQLIALDRLPTVAAAFVAGDQATKDALAAVWKSSIDPQGVLGYGGVGLWVFVVSFAGLRGERFPPPLAWLGIAVAVLYWLVPVGLITDVSGLLFVPPAGAIVLATAWYGWAGVLLLRAGR